MKEIQYYNNPVLLANHNPETSEVIAHIDFDALIIWEWLTIKEYIFKGDEYNEKRDEIVEKANRLINWLSDMQSIMWYKFTFKYYTDYKPTSDEFVITFSLKRTK